MQSTPTAIPEEIARQICADIRKQYRGKFWTLAGMQCWGCTTFTKGDSNKMCLASREDFRGCNLVNEKFDKKSGSYVIRRK